MELLATDYLLKPSKYPATSICVLVGDDEFFKSEVMKNLRDVALGGDDAEFSFYSFDAATITFVRLLEELTTVAMFGGCGRVVNLEAADSFVTKYRDEMEKYAEKPSSSNFLLLQLKTFPATTKLYKKVAASNLIINCKSWDDKREKDCVSWVARWATLRHDLKLNDDAASVMVQLVGMESGLLEQELAKLALVVKDKSQTITAKVVTDNVGAWRKRTIFEMIDLALAGKCEDAITQLSRLIAAGETPVGIIAQISSTLRKLAAATRLIQDVEATGKKITVSDALTQLGNIDPDLKVNPYFKPKLEQQLKTLGRKRGGSLLRWLLETDMNLKGGGESRAEPRFILERLIIQLSAKRDS
ncbi:MAG: DNA polymerase III subunit delta [Planctomycetaceae bacterium]|nr:DNA polymerase III subunit delta [Planctomycetaceae bacterium]